MYKIYENYWIPMQVGIIRVAGELFESVEYPQKNIGEIRWIYRDNKS